MPPIGLDVDAGLVGGKALRLLQLRALGLPVPPFVVVTTGAFREAIENDPVVTDCVARLRREMDARRPDPARLKALSEKASARVRFLGCPDALARALREAIARHRLRRCRLAVRSSAVVEDSVRHSFAGLLDSELGVDAERVPEAVVRVWASAFSPRALAYRSRLGIGLAGLATAVVVQELVEATASGVLFTRHPDEPGTIVVVGRSRPRRGRRPGHGGVRHPPRLALERRRSSATPLPARRPSSTTPRSGTSSRGRSRSSGLSGGHRTSSGRSTPAAASTSCSPGPSRCPSLPPRGEPRLFENANVVESYPGLTRPLTFSFALEGYERAFRRAAEGSSPSAARSSAAPTSSAA